MKEKKKNNVGLIVLAGVLLLVCFMGILVFYFLNLKKQSNTYTDIDSFTYHHGSGQGIACEYDITNEKGKYILTAHIRDMGKIVLDERKVVSTADMEKLSDIIKENNIKKWDGFVGKSDALILDGGGFSLVIKYKNGEKIEARGYTVFPDNYNEVTKKLDNFLKKIAKK